jgi:ATPase subunit of ABC transporter with duplicated ATPase domains
MMLDELANHLAIASQEVLHEAMARHEGAITQKSH